jgi:hypothetical protein
MKSKREIKITHYFQRNQLILPKWRKIKQKLKAIDWFRMR